jgi:hypothetical protein
MLIGVNSVAFLDFQKHSNIQRIHCQPGHSTKHFFHMQILYHGCISDKLPSRF